MRDFFSRELTWRFWKRSSRSKLKLNKRKIDFFTPSCRAVKSAGIGLPAKSRAPALVAGWAPRISQTPGFGARLSYFAMRPAPHLHQSTRNFLLCRVSTLQRGQAIIRIFNVFLMSFLYYSSLMLVARPDACFLLQSILKLKT